MGDCGVRVVGNMSKDIGMGVRKGTVVSFVPTLLVAFWGFHFFWGGLISVVFLGGAEHI